jgi:hypothetical protein
MVYGYPIDYLPSAISRSISTTMSRPEMDVKSEKKILIRENLLQLSAIVRLAVSVSYCQLSQAT